MARPKKQDNDLEVQPAPDVAESYQPLTSHKTSEEEYGPAIKLKGIVMHNDVYFEHRMTKVLSKDMQWQGNVNVTYFPKVSFVKVQNNKTTKWYNSANVLEWMPL